MFLNKLFWNTFEFAGRIETPFNPKSIGLSQATMLKTKKSKIKLNRNLKQKVNIYDDW